MGKPKAEAETGKHREAALDVHSHIGSSFEDWLREEGLFEECDAEARRRVKEWRVATQRESLGRTLGELFTHWGLSPQEQAALLGLAEGEWTAGTPLPDGEGIQERAGHFLRIHEDLRVIFPENPDLVYRWMTMPNRQFDGLRPVDAVRGQGEDGLKNLRRYLDLERSR